MIDPVGPSIWLPALKLTQTEKSYIVENEEICDKIVNSFMTLLNKDYPHLHFQSSNFSAPLLEYSPFETIHVHHNGSGHFCTSSSIGGSVQLFDSLNKEPTEALTAQLTALYSPDSAIPSIFTVPMQSTQAGGVDCGLFALAFAVDLARGCNPSRFVYDQARFRTHLLRCLKDHKAVPFPKLGEHPEVSVPREYTRDVPVTEKWTAPKQFSPRVLLDDCSAAVSTQNRYSALSTDFTVDRNSASQPDSDCISDSPQRRVPQRCQSGNVINLSSRVLTKHEMSLLNFGLSFSPSKKSIDKEQFCEDTYKFIRRMKLREHFGSNSSAPYDTEDDRDSMSWTSSNPDWYPKEIQEGGSVGLRHCLDRTVEDLKNSLIDNDDKFWNNLSSDQRRALDSLKRDTSIVIKPSDKSGGVVIMDRADYEEKCLDLLSDSTFYECLEDDPNPAYRVNLDTVLDDLKSDKLLSDVEHSNMQKGDRTPNFYILPKVHKVYEGLPDRRPICSGSNGVTEKTSEFVDSFLKHAARKTSSYIRDTIDFVKKIKEINLPSSSPIFLATMDVKSLYTNIEHAEGIAACHQFLDERRNKRFPTDKLCDLIKLILESNTMKFGHRFFHQLRGTAMGTPMAVNYANLFMSSFETKMLHDFEAEHGVKPLVWIRFIDDIFFVWNESEELLNAFIDFANKHAVRNGYKSRIEFTSQHSNKSVSFLDTIVRVEGCQLTTDLFIKPTSSHDYVHRSSYHPQHLLSALPKSQFMRVRRICTHLKDYKRHVQLFISFFKRRGYREGELQKLAANIENLSQESLLGPQLPKSNAADRVPFVLSYHHKFLGIAGILRKNYNNMVRDYPVLKTVFPEVPMVAFRRQRNLKDHLVRADHCAKIRAPIIPRHTKADIQPFMNNSGLLTNEQTKKVHRIEGGSANDRNVIYAVKCKVHKLINVGFTSQPLNERMNGHRSDIDLSDPKCELVQHFMKHGCDFRKDIEISVLKHVTGSFDRLSFEEDKWITKLDTRHPNGMNEKLSGYASLYYKLFN